MITDRAKILGGANPNVYCAGRDGAIDLPISEALELSQKILASSTPDRINTKLLTAKAHDLIGETDDQPAFEHSKARIAYLALNFAINELGTIAPFFRPQLRNPAKVAKNVREMSLIDAIYSLDQQLIDLHWIFCRFREEHQGDSFEYEFDYNTINVWEDDNFYPEGVSAFVHLEWAASTKAKELCLNEFEQLQLKKLRSKAIADRQNYIRRSEKASKAKIREYIRKSKQLLPSDLDEWYCDLVALRLANQDVSDATRLRSLMTGIRIADSEFATARKKMQRRKAAFGDKMGLLR